MCKGMVSVTPGMWPDTTETAPNSPMARAVHSSTPASRAQAISGKVTRKKVDTKPAPSMAAASSCARPCACISGITVRATKGKVTNTVASTMPGVANTICTSCAASAWPNQPLAPNSSTQTRPEITGEMVSGNSMITSSTRLPGKSNFVRHQAAARPHAVFSGTAMAATSKVRRMAESASGSINELRAKAKPWRSASANTVPSGSTNRIPTTSTAVASSNPRLKTAPPAAVAPRSACSAPASSRPAWQHRYRRRPRNRIPAGG